MIFGCGTGRPSARPSSKQKCSFSAWPSKSPDGGLRMWVVGTRPEGTPHLSFSTRRAVLGCPPGKTELAGIAWHAPGGVVLAQGAQAQGNTGFIEPFNRGQGISQDGFKPFGPHELDRSGAVLADTSDEPECVPCRDMEFARPMVEHHFVVGQESPQVRIDLGISMLGECEGHRNR